MKTKIVVIFVTFLLLVSSSLIMRTVHAQQTPGAPVHFSFEPVALGPLTNTNSSVNGLETPATPSPTGQYFNIEIHLEGATADNVPAGIAGVEVHFDFSSILAYAQPINFTNDLGTSDGVLAGPPSALIYAIQAGLYDNSDNLVTGPPYTNASRFEVAAASTVTTTTWNATDGLVAVILFQITIQPSQQDFYASMTSILTSLDDLVDGNYNEVQFDVVPATLHIDASIVPGQQYHTLTANIVGNGSVTQSPLDTNYLNGTVVTLTAVPSSGWKFQAWSGDVTGTQNPASVTMDANKTVMATFVQVHYTLTVSVVGGGFLFVNPSTHGLLTYSSGTVVTLTAVAASAWSFQAWSGDVTGTQNPTTITMNANETVTATFASTGTSIPEFQPLMLLSLLLASVEVAALVHRRKR